MENKFFVLYIFLLQILIKSLCAENVLQYFDNDFNEKLKSHDIAFVAYYAPWCRYSQALLPEYSKTAFILNQILKTDVGIIKVDCYDQNSIATCNSMKILSYPTLRVYKSGVFFREFRSERTADTMVYFILDIIHGLIV